MLNDGVFVQCLHCFKNRPKVDPLDRSLGEVETQFRAMYALLKSVQAQFDGATVDHTEFKTRLDKLLEEIERGK
jgi:hypothetical protein